MQPHMAELKNAFYQLSVTNMPKKDFNLIIFEYYTRKTVKNYTLTMINKNTVMVYRLS